MRIALVNLLVDTRSRSFSTESIVPPLALGYLSQFLRKSGYRADIFDSSAFAGESVDFIKAHRVCDYDLVGLTTYSLSFLSIIDFTLRLKALNPDLKVVLGGPHVSALPRETLECFPDVDFVVCHEGELTLLELVQNLEGGGYDRLKYISGLAFRDGEDVLVNDPRPRIEDIDSLPYPDRFVNGSYQPFCLTKSFDGGRSVLLRDFPIHSSRGCPFSCSFCFLTVSQDDRRWRPRNLENVIEEIRAHYRQKPFDLVNFSDANFFIDPGRALSIGEGIKGIHPDLRWCFQTRPDLVVKHKAFLTELGDLGCDQIHLGVESISDAFLQKYKKGITPEHNREAADLLKSRDMLGGVYMIPFYPEATLESFRENLHFMDENFRVDTVADTLNYQVSMTAFPGTELFREKGEKPSTPEVHIVPSTTFEDETVGFLCEQVKGFFRSYYEEMRRLETRIRGVLYEFGLLVERKLINDSPRCAKLSELQDLILFKIQMTYWPRQFIDLALGVASQNERRIDENESLGSGVTLRSLLDRIKEMSVVCDDVWVWIKEIEKNGSPPSQAAD